MSTCEGSKEPCDACKSAVQRSADEMLDRMSRYSSDEVTRKMHLKKIISEGHAIDQERVKRIQKYLPKPKKR